MKFIKSEMEDDRVSSNMETVGWPWRMFDMMSKSSLWHTDSIDLLG